MASASDVMLRTSDLARLGLVDDASIDLADAALLLAAADHPANDTRATLDTARAS